MTGPLDAPALISIGQDGCHLHGAPVAAPDTVPGAVGIILGFTCDGRPVILASESLEWLDDLEAAAQVARSRGIVQAGMTVRS